MFDALGAENIFFEGGFVYFGIPGLMTALSLLNDDYNDMAGFMWLIVGILYSWQYGVFFLALGVTMATLHLYVFTKLRVMKAIRSAKEAMNVH